MIYGLRKTSWIGLSMEMCFLTDAIILLVEDKKVLDIQTRRRFEDTAKMFDFLKKNSPSDWSKMRAHTLASPELFDFVQHWSDSEWEPQIAKLYAIGKGEPLTIEGCLNLIEFLNKIGGRARIEWRNDARQPRTRRVTTTDSVKAIMVYQNLNEMLNRIPEVAGKLQQLIESELFRNAAGSSHNHQAWEGGYLNHITETMNIACWLYETCPRKLPFTLEDALVVLFLHDIEKPFKGSDVELGSTKEERRNFRDAFIQKNQIVLTQEQSNALRYVEGEDDYSGNERKMGALAAFCHCCDILSARLWWFHGEEEKW